MTNESPPNERGARPLGLDWLLCAAALTVSALALAFGHATEREGAALSFEVTILASDEHDLACASDDKIDGARCEFDARGVARPEPAEAVLRPYLTVSRDLVLLQGLFEESHVRAWQTDAERRVSSARVVVRCQGQYLGHTSALRVRWTREQPWIRQSSVLAARIHTCRVAPL